MKSSAARKYEPAVSPVALVSIKDVRPCDLVVIQGTGRVLCLEGLELETKEVEVKPGGILSDPEYDRIEGVFDPETGAMLFDREGWLEHQVKQRLHDATMLMLKEDEPLGDDDTSGSEDESDEE